MSVFPDIADRLAYSEAALAAAVTARRDVRNQLRAAADGLEGALASSPERLAMLCLEYGRAHIAVLDLRDAHGQIEAEASRAHRLRVVPPEQEVA